MPLLNRRKNEETIRPSEAVAAGNPGIAESAELHGAFSAMPRTAIFPRCVNPQCANGWMRLWRSRSAPVFEEGWCCSPECTRRQVDAALSRELGLGAGQADGYRHRIPLGLSMLENGWISAQDLRFALQAQRAGGAGRLGQWLVRQGSVSEAKVTRALAQQWSCPVLGLELRDPEAMALMMPRLFVDAFGVLPVRIAAQRILYLGFEDRPDPVLEVALEKMTGMRVECGVVEGSSFRAAHERVLEARFAPVQLMEVGSESGLAAAVAGAIEKAQPVAARLVRVHDFLWLRIWKRRQAAVVPRREDVCDLICTLTPKGGIA